MPVLIPHGITPTGFGLRRRAIRSQALRPTSPCCGQMMEGSLAKCMGCGEGHYSPALQASLANDVNVPIDPSNHDIIISWIRHLTGIPDLEVDIS